MIVIAYSSIYHRPSSSSSPIVSGASGSSSSPTNPAIPSAREPQDWRNRRRQSSPMDRPRRVRAARARRIPPATSDRARRPSTSFPRPRGGWPRSLGGPASVDRPAPSSERARRGESERRAVGRFRPRRASRTASPIDAMRCGAMRFRSPCNSSSARVPTAPGSIASIGHPREATGSDRISRRELADRDPPRATPPKRERTRRGGGARFGIDRQHERRRRDGEGEG